MKLQRRMVSKNSILSTSGRPEEMDLWGSFCGGPGRNGSIKTAAHPDDITCFHMVGKERFLGSHVMSFIRRQKAGKVLDGKNRMCAEKSPQLHHQSLLTFISITRNYFTCNE